LDVLGKYSLENVMPFRCLNGNVKVEMEQLTTMTE